MSQSTSAFRPAIVAALLLAGSVAFLLLLYAVGAGWTGASDRNGGAHGASNSLNGFTGLVDLLERRGYQVTLSRTPGALSDHALLVLTPSLYEDAEQIRDLIEARKHQGPTLLVLPKWQAFAVPEDPRIEAEDGWVIAPATSSPAWLAEMAPFANLELATGTTSGWAGLGLEGDLPEPDKVQAIVAQPDTILFPMVVDSEDHLLAGYWNQNGHFPDLAATAGVRFTPAVEERQDDSIWPLVVVVEPDLLNNYGLADRDRALQAVRLFEAALDGYDLPIVFDLTIPGLGSGDNLLTLAFRPPFLAATLCLLMAAIIIAWRGFLRFGPPSAGVPALSRGKTQLARNGAALVERARRWHLLGPPYAAMAGSRIARSLGIRDGEEGAREAAIDAAMKRREIDDVPFSQRARTLRLTGRPAELIRAAQALREIERKLAR